MIVFANNKNINNNWPGPISCMHSKENGLFALKKINKGLFQRAE